MMLSDPWKWEYSHYQGGSKDRRSNSHKFFLHFDSIITHVCFLGLRFGFRVGSQSVH